MKKTILSLIFCLAVASASQVVPGRYIVELSGDPAAQTMGRFGRTSAQAREHLSRVGGEQRVAARAINARGGRVLGAVDTVFNALFVQTDNPESLRGIPGVKSIRPVRMVWAKMDRAVGLSNVPQAWTRIGGQDKAGQEVGVAILDSGIDVTHPGFADAGMPPAPSGYPLTSSEANKALVNKKIVAARSYEDLNDPEGYGTDASDMNGHGTSAAFAAAGTLHKTPVGDISGVAPKAWLGNYKVLGNNGGGSDAGILKGIDDAVKDGFPVINMSLGSDTAGDPAKDTQVAAVENATKAGVIVLIAAGNAGPDVNTINSPGTAPSAITVGSSSNDRSFSEDGTKPIDANRMSDFSSRGPSLSAGLKPDMVATGDNFYTATTSLKDGQTYYTITQGTSFATPFTAGVAAMLISARPELKEPQLRSVLVNSSAPIVAADNKPITVRFQGAGRANADATLQATLAMSPVALNFGTGSANPDVERELNISNLGKEAATVTLSAQSYDGKTTPTLSASSINLNPGATGTVKVRFAGTALSGEYQGSIRVSTSNSPVVSNVAYWYGVPSTTPAAIALLEAPTAGGAAGATVQFGFRVVDASGIAIPTAEAKIVPVSGGGSVVDAGYDEGGRYFMVALKLGDPGQNVFRITSGSLTRDITIPVE